MKEILPGIYTWHEYSEEKQLNFNGYFLVSGEESVLVDPPRMTEKDIAELESLVEKDSIDKDITENNLKDKEIVDEKNVEELEDQNENTLDSVAFLKK